jgi:acetyltransferase
VPLPALEEKTARALHEVVPDFGSVANPSDLTAEVLKTSETFGFCLDAFLNDSSFSALVMPMIFAHAGVEWRAGADDCGCGGPHRPAAGRDLDE